MPPHVLSDAERDQVLSEATLITGQTRLNQYWLKAINQDGRRWAFDLSQVTERNWWSYTMIPPGPGHPRSTVAVGTEAGVAIFDLETGLRTRVLAGPSGPVVSVVPSPDGRWLAASSLDQTIMIYPLAGCDTRPGLAPRFEGGPTAHQRAVARVEPRGCAAGMGLVPGDVVTRAAVARGTQVTYLTTTPRSSPSSRDGSTSCRPIPS